MGRYPCIIKRNFKLLGRAFARYCGALFAITTAILAFVSCEDFGIVSVQGKIMLMVAVTVAAFFAACLEVVVRRFRVVWRCGEGELDACYGDLFALVKKSKGMCVIPVNTAFDTIVENVGEAPDGKPLVSPRTIHGEWVRRMTAGLGTFDGGMALDELDERIAAVLEAVRPVRVESEGRGKHERYAIGTVAPVMLEDVTYLLVALSEFDDNNNAHSSEGDLLVCLEAVLDWQKIKGQGADLFLPIMGTGLSSMGLDRQESFDRTIAFIRARAGKVRGKVSVVVYEGDREQVSIWE